MAAPLTTNRQQTIPTIWTERILKRDFNVVLGKMLQPNQSHPEETENPYLRSANIKWEGVDISDVKTMWFSQHEKHDLRLHVGDLLVNEGGDVGRCAVWMGELEECYFQNAINRVQPRNDASTRFLYYWLYNLKNAGFIDAVVSRTTIAHLTAEKLEAVPWSSVPTSTQKQISIFLDASCAAIDAAMAAKRRQVEVLISMIASLITQSVVHGLDQNAVSWDLIWPWFKGVPKHWRYGHLKRFTTRIQTGVTPPTENPEYYEDGTIPWFAPGSYDGNLELHSPRKLINETALHAGVLRMFPVGTIFFVGIGATIGKVGMVTMPASCNQQIIGIVASHDLLPRYLAYQMKVYENIISRISIATTLPIFDQAKTAYLPVVVPPKQEQETICKFLDAKTIESKRTIAIIESQIDTLTAYRKSLIHECVTGQRRVTDADVNRAKAAMQT